MIELGFAFGRGAVVSGVTSKILSDTKISFN
jgi:hypothetical protein